MLRGTRSPRSPRASRVGVMLLTGLAALGLLGWILVVAARPLPPRLPPVRGGWGELTREQGIWILSLRGGAAQIGERHGTLARDLMRKVDESLEASFREHVPSLLVRWLLPPLVELQYRHLPSQIPRARVEELAAEAAAYAPFDRMRGFLPTYPRLLLYQALYDVALSFEHSPLLGCSVFGVSGAASTEGHLLIGRNFDLEQDAFDRDKVVVRVQEEGRIPYASVAWAGMVGVVTGLSAAGIYASVNGARADAPRRQGVPLPFVLREVLANAHSLDQAIELALASPVMVPHILFLGDGGSGQMAVVERSPSRSFVRRAPPGTFFATNHFLTEPLASDPQNRRVERSSSTLARYARLAVLLPPRAPPLGLDQAIAILRDHAAADGTPLAATDRRALDAQIATHSVVADATARVLYVAQGPHTAGRYVRIPVTDP